MYKPKRIKDGKFMQLQQLSFPAEHPELPLLISHIQGGFSSLTNDSVDYHLNLRNI